MRRRHFLRMTGGGAAGALLFPGSVAATSRKKLDVRLTILHTNDTHSRVDPFPMDGGPNQGLGGLARRSTLVNRVRAETPNVLLLDSGDIFQGTPFFNFFGGEIEFKAMSAMNYDVVTLGNHDFDNGVDGLVEMMPHASFQFVSANYDCSESPLDSYVQPWVVKELGGIKVGIFGLGVSFEGLVLASLHKGVRYTDPFNAARRSVRELRARGCSLVVCLSHLGYRYGGSKPSDTLLAQEVEGIDLVLGGHTHTFMDEPDIYSHADGSRTLVNQVGWAGMRVGRIDVVMEPSVSGTGNQAPSHSPRAWDWQNYAVDSMPT